MKVKFQIGHRKSKSDINDKVAESFKILKLGKEQPQNKSSKNILKSSKRIKYPQISKRLQRLSDVKDNLMKQYCSLLKMYQTNEWKLFKIIQNQLNSNNYVYCKQVLSFIKYPQLQALRSVKLNIFENDLKKITKFMTQFNAKKKIRQVQIIKESMINRQQMIRKSADDRQYYEIYRKMRVPVKMNQGLTIYDQFKGILYNHNATSQKSKVHEQLFTKICDAQEGIYNLIKKVNETNKRKKIQKFRQSVGCVI